MPARARKPRIGYLSGPAEAFRFFEEMADDRSDYFGTNYMKRFLALASELDVDAYVITWHEGDRYDLTAGALRFVNRPVPHHAGLLYHLGLILWCVRFLAAMLRFRPDVMVMTGNQNYWWVFAPLRLIGTQFVASYHSALWPKFTPRSLVNRVLNRLNAWLILKAMPAVVSTSHDIDEQVIALAGAEMRARIIDHLPTYSRAQFAAITPPVAAAPPFNTIFLSRVEANKGVFHLLEIAGRLNERAHGGFVFYVCGAGTDSDRFASEIGSRSLGDVVIAMGQCGPARIVEVMNRCHALIVPTRSDLEVGFEMPCAEAILSGRPLVTSAVCPGLHYVRPAAIEVRPDDVAGYADAIARLAGDPVLYDRLVAACDPLKQQFFDEANSWTTAMRKALARTRAFRATP